MKGAKVTIKALVALNWCPSGDLLDGLSLFCCEEWWEESGQKSFPQLDMDKSKEQQ